MDAFRCDCQLPDSCDKFRAINPQFPSCLSLHGDDILSGMTIAIVQSIFFCIHPLAVGGVVEKNSPKQFLLIYFPVAKISTIAERGLFWFSRSIHCGLEWEGRRRRKNREKSVESLWNHHNLLFVDDFQVFHSSKQT